MKHQSHRVEHTLEIDQPIEQVYRVLIDSENHPSFVPGLTVRHKGDEGVWQWALKTRQGREIAWDMKLVGLKHDNRVISWHTVRMADVAHNGAITLEALGGDKTRLNFVVEYEPSAPLCQHFAESGEPEFSGERFAQQADQAIIQALDNLRDSLVTKHAL